MQGAHMQGVHMQGAHMQGVHMQGVHMQGAHMQGAHMQGVHMQGAHMHTPSEQSMHGRGQSSWLAAQQWYYHCASQLKNKTGQATRPSC